jgi:hypothetical protein
MIAIPSLRFSKSIGMVLSSSTGFTAIYATAARESQPAGGIRLRKNFHQTRER